MAIMKDVLDKARSWYTSSPMLRLGDMELRDYQVEAAWNSYLHDTLVVLPTGLGKTMIAVLQAAMFITDMQDEQLPGIIVMLAPTRALLLQHQALFTEKLAVNPDSITIIDGAMQPTARAKFYAGLAIDAPALLFMTPQTLDNDLQKNRFHREKLAAIIFDEAHHATLDHPYVLIYNDLVKHGCKARVLALTASPGENEEEIAAICTNLGIEPSNAIFKAREDDDVQPYIHAITIQRTGVDLQPAWYDMLDTLKLSLAQCCTWLVMAGVAEADVILGKEFKKAIPKMFFLDLFQKYSAGEDGGGGNLRFQIMSRLATCIKLHHAIEMLETYGIDAFLDYHDSMMEDFKKRKTKATAEVLLDQGYNAVIQVAGELKHKGDSSQRDHPKLVVLKSLLEEFLAANPASKVLVFVNYRASIKMICDYIDTSNLTIKIHRFVGQGTRKKSDEGMKRDRQSKILQQFKQGAYNVLVATSVAEEGLDIAECDLVVFYETVASVIKFIQRQGRTGRKHAGNVAILYTRGTMDEFRMKALDSKLSKLRGVYYNFKNVKPGEGNILDTKEPSKRPALQQRIDAFTTDAEMTATKQVPHVSISDLKHWQDAKPITISNVCVLAKELSASLKQMRVPVSVVPPSGLPDITIGKGLGIKVMTLSNAATECLENRIFAMLASLKATYDNVFVVAWDDGKPLETDLTKSIIVEWLERFGELEGVKVLTTSTIDILATIIADFHGRVANLAIAARKEHAGASA
ncbi:MAG TPA: helicase-related protein [Candidatus Lokiarchaeia archaeon]|nr:helicase-related protein [Candidatus Lokiarchaeia archaeon]